MQRPRGRTVPRTSERPRQLTGNEQEMGVSLGSGGAVGREASQLHLTFNPLSSPMLGHPGVCGVGVGDLFISLIKSVLSQNSGKRAFKGSF